VKDLHNRQQHIEADHIGKGKRTDRVIAAKLHPLIDIGRTCGSRAMCALLFGPTALDCRVYAKGYAR
jgi:hypothetical protein